MQNKKLGVILIGHGGLPSDIPKEIIEDFMKVHKQRIRTGTPITSKEKELDNVIRFWTRSPATDPYKYGLEASRRTCSSTGRLYFNNRL